IELLVGNSLRLAMLDRRRPRRAVETTHLESGVMVDHDHLVATPEMRIPSPGLELPSDAIDVVRPAGDPVDVPAQHRTLIIAQDLVGRDPCAPHPQPVDERLVPQAFADHASIEVFVRHAVAPRPFPDVAHPERRLHDLAASPLEPAIASAYAGAAPRIAA